MNTETLTIARYNYTVTSNVNILPRKTGDRPFKTDIIAPQNRPDNIQTTQFSVPQLEQT